MAAPGMTEPHLSMDPDGRALVAALPNLLPMGAQPAALVTVIEAHGSAPRGPGARMLVRGGALLAGTVGGGHLEQIAMDEASALLKTSPDFDPVARDWALGPALAQCCGGRVVVRMEPVTPEAAQALATRLCRAEAQASLFVTGEAAHRLAERPSPPWTVVIFGAGHVARALAHVLAVHPWQVVVVDARPEWATPGAFPQTTRILAQPPVEVLKAWGWLGVATADSTSGDAPLPGRCLAIIMTHDHELDRQLAWALLQRRDTGAEGLAHLGVIGSRTKITTLRRRLRDQGVSETALGYLSAPIGLRQRDAAGIERPIGGKRPGEIATSVAAELMVRIAEFEHDGGCK